MSTDTVKYTLSEAELPTHWINLLPDLPGDPMPPLNPGTMQPAGPDDLTPIFPMGVIQQEVSTGTALTVAMQNANIFPSMVIQMVSIGEETGSLDSMLSKVADFFEAEVDDAVEALSSLMEPLIMVVLGTLIGSMVVAMYLPIFKLGGAV